MKTQLFIFSLIAFIAGMLVMSSIWIISSKEDNAKTEESQFKIGSDLVVSGVGIEGPSEYVERSNSYGEVYSEIDVVKKSLISLWNQMNPAEYEMGDTAYVSGCEVYVMNSQVRYNEMRIIREYEVFSYCSHEIFKVYASALSKEPGSRFGIYGTHNMVETSAIEKHFFKQLIL